MLGMISLVFMGILFFRAGRMDQAFKTQQMEAGEKKDLGQAALVLDSEELVYDGSGTLELLSGVTALDTDGTDMTSQVNAVITGRGSRNRKIVRYSVFTSDGRELTAQRQLLMKDYEGPQLEVAKSLSIQAEELPDLVSALQKRGELRAEDGFGRDCSGKVSWVREKVSEGRYDVTFSFTNDYRDSVSRTVNAAITGVTKDIVLTLSQTEAEVLAGTHFEPMDYVEQAGSSKDRNDLGSRVRAESHVDTDNPGTYPVIYTLMSLDNTQKARARLLVTVTGGAL